MVAVAIPPLADEALLVALGAVPGALLRYGLMTTGALRLPRRFGAAAAANLLACLLLGLVLAALEGVKGSGQGRLLLLLVTGFLGSLSTFSTWMLELVQTLEEGQRRRALATLAGPLLLGLGALQLGMGLSRQLLALGR